MVNITKGKKNTWVTFVLECGEEPVIKGSWDGWKEHIMKKRKDGKYSYRRPFKQGAYEFGYMCENRWITENELPKNANPFGGENSVLVI
jgi:hypothetical protein